MTVEMVKMSSKGQIVIPQDIRAEISASEGTMFAIVSGRDSIVLKKVKTPTKEELIRELKEIAEEGRKRAEKIGIKESDVPDLVHKLRASKK
ncbi:AbrB/MazE/SpoVT family DNA-binding domain-containing protein [Candidatus Pacearchaeota archaeon]|nr:AbrB/MazE/SpoVT family DNA-binding domain-containing protein [Candidatus Pacearchaeota archaeon]